MVGAPDAGRGHVDLARIGLGIGNELRDGLGWHRWIDHHHGRNANDACDGLDILDEVELERVVKRPIDGVGLRDPNKRVAVRRRLHDCLGGDIGAGARPIFDDELLAKPLRKPLSDQSGGDIGRSASGKADDDAHWSRRIIARP